MTVTRYEKFDWKYSIGRWSAESVNFLWNNHYKDFSEDEFVKGYTNLGRPRHSPSRAHKEYNNLKNKFGFFTGQVDYRKKKNTSA